MKDLISKLDAIIDQANIEQKTEGSYGYLPHITSTLVDIRNSLDGDFPDAETREKVVGNIGYIILDNMPFAESPLGEKIIDLINEYRHLD